MVGFPKYEPVHDFLAKLKEAMQSPRDLAFHIDRLQAIERLFFKRFCPYKPGDRVRVTSLPPEAPGNTPGYVRAYNQLRGLEHPEGTVKSIDISYLHPDRLKVTVEWDDISGDWQRFPVLDDQIEHTSKEHPGADKFASAVF